MGGSWDKSMKIFLNGMIHNRRSPDNKVHGAKMGPIWGRQDPGGPRVGPMNIAILEFI